MNNAERIAELVGGKSRLAEAAEIDNSLVSRWCKSGNVPSKYRTRIIHHAHKVCSQQEVEEIASLIPDNVCKCCGQTIRV